MDSYLQHHHSNQQQQQMSSGLTRYRSAPTSFFASLLNDSGGGGGGDYGGDDLDHLFNSRASNRDAFSRFTYYAAAKNSNTNHLSNIEQNSGINNLCGHSYLMASIKPKPDVQQQQEMKDYSSASQMMYQSQGLAQQSHNSLAPPPTSAMDSSFKLVASINSSRSTQMKTDGGRSVVGGHSNLIRHSSSPAGLFDQIDIENEYGAMRGMGNFAAGDNGNAEASFSTSSRFKDARDFSSSGEGLMAPVSQAESKDQGNAGHPDGNFGDSSYTTSFADTSWDDSAMLSEEFLKELRDDNPKLFSSENASDTQQYNESPSRPPKRLAHHLSLPTSSAELSVLENLSEDTVFCKLRAKRGCATHPRSIAERVRRTKISERMRKLQELVPNMDKQTNTADMLDLAVDYIKDLEKHLKMLQENREKCTCK